jgi:hypothetical protein
VTFTISADDPRSIRAIEIAAEADYWLSGVNRDGDAVFGVPSQREKGRYYIVTRYSCDCADFKQRGDTPCKHILAVRLHTELVRAQQYQPKKPTPGQRRRGHLTLIS